ncbi:50S ribosomal protein L30 [Algiphilus sp.]|uniref:50S ribosomal protein L30 n=1 Tax=Algiphilus sp. TaxID=1872431 RepID=UPI0025BA5752|nr:50S ribosomal protein L30 [Algiphilus sp.]MCK5770462.1 50S ribosomal protein L30 [Algiphilus sp.]
MPEQKKIRVTLVRSLAGRLQQHRNNVNGLGLRKIGDSREVIATPANMGMVRKAEFLLRVEEV